MPLGEVLFQSLGSVQEVGASAHLIEIDGLRLLLDCGLHPKKEGLSALPRFDLLDTPPDAVLISHAHHDHCAGLPYLLKLHPGVVPYATPATLRIMDRMLHNSVSVMEKIRLERGIEEYPLYSHDDVENAIRKAYGIAYGREFGILPDSPVRVRFSPAGHVLGSASIRIDGTTHSIFYTGDICTIDQELMGRFHFPERAVTTLIVESTYGANEEADRIEFADEVENLAAGLRRVIGREGVTLIPTFALGRTQEVLNILARLEEEGRIPAVPIYVSGLGRAIYEIYDRFSELLKPGSEIAPLSDFRSIGDATDPVILEKLLSEPAIIVATSGMMIENTPSAVIAEHLVQDPRNAIFFVGYCDPDTLGHKVKHARPGDRLVFKLGGQPVENRLDTIEYHHFSAHAHRKDLQDVIGQINAKNVVFVHGDPPAVEWMHDNAANGAVKHAPAVGQTVRLTT